jgi:hypothetical protein
MDSATSKQGSNMTRAVSLNPREVLELTRNEEEIVEHPSSDPSEEGSETGKSSGSSFEFH